MKNILLPTDFSDNAWNAIFTALKMFEISECNFVLLNSYEPKISNLLGNKSKERLGVIYDSLYKNSKLQLEKTLHYLQKNHARDNHDFETESVSNNMENAVKQMVVEKKIDLIIMGTKGATGAKEVFMGSNTVRVIKKVRTCPILAVPGEYDFKALKKVVFPTDFSHNYGKTELRQLLDLVGHWKAEILILQVAQEQKPSESQKQQMKTLSRCLKSVYHSYHTIEMKNNVAEATTKFAADNRADLIALIHYPHTFMEKLTREPVIRKMGFHSKIPLLVLPDI
ncbi:universal stress protein [Maribacter polysiphoniae]|uniref:Nucleotide-binding universal stress UspA family protein n=1 Tax=Maribacter polysiphoniae TaxID=429344 RepID=A0A316ENU4_9FLAO|nr:universal stress protein [Maribacter polysiphoniae]MBD1259084.1 universal stress protein [Maribacter polysiphoniae]PWK24640.1 nucleotide-binding universal stress UspA family protein [Maribacter polysiphoniae]